MVFAMRLIETISKTHRIAMPTWRISHELAYPPVITITYWRIKILTFREWSYWASTGVAGADAVFFAWI